jgi:hypothetical protein
VKKGIQLTFGFWFLVFLYFAVVQYNDPDSMLWIAFYACAGMLAAIWAFVLYPGKAVFLISAAVCIVLAILQWPDQWEGFGDAMHNKNTERAREAFGMLITACALVFYAFGGNYLHKRKQS